MVRSSIGLAVSTIILLAALMVGLRSVGVLLEHRAMDGYTNMVASEIERMAARAIKPVDPQHIRCLAENIYWEAAGEPFMGQVAVARVVVNRVKHGFAGSPCKVVYQSHTVPDLDNPDGVKKVCQFSWVCEGKGQPPRNESYRQAEEIARKVLGENKWSEQIPGNILFFHNTGVDPKWGYRKVMEIGNHLFYKK